MKNKIINYLKYHHAASLICFSFIAIILTILFSCGIYGNESLNDIDKDLKNYHSNIYVTTFYKSVASQTYANENSHIFQKSEAKYIDQLKDKTPIYFSLPYDIEKNTNKYADSIYQLESGTDNAINIQYRDGKKHTQNYKNRITDITYDESNKPTSSQIIRTINDEGVYINEHFLKNYGISINDINKDSILTFTIHVPLYYENSGTSSKRIVHSVIVNKKIKAIIKDNQDFMKISDAQNLIFYSLSECNELIDQYAKENNNNQYAPAYSIHSSKTNIIESYNQLDKKTSNYQITNANKEDGLSVISHYYDCQKLYQNIYSIKTKILYFNNMISVLFLLYIILNIKKFISIKKEYSLALKKFSLIERKQYLKKSMFTEIEVFIFTYLLTLLLIRILFELFPKNIHTSYFDILILLFLITPIAILYFLLRYIIKIKKLK